MINKRFILAVDGGGTSTDIAVARIHEQIPAEIIGRASGHPTNLTTLGTQSAARELLKIVRDAVQDIEPLPKFELALIALAGAGTPEAKVRLAAWLTEYHLAETVRVMSDADLTLSLAQCSAPEDHAVIALIAGTGSIAFGCLPDADTPIRAGGWGATLGDDGGGYWLGRAALRHTLEVLDRELPLTELAQAVVGVFHAESSRDLVRSVHASSDSVRRIAAMAPLVVQAAEQGDYAASQLVDEAADHLCELLRVISRRLGHPQTHTSIACNGSLVVKAASIRQRLESFARQSGYAAIYFVEDPVVAAIHLAAAAVSRE